MSDVTSQARHAWRQLEGDWADATLTWAGVTAERFAWAFWAPLDEDTRRFLGELDALLAALDEAERVARA